MVVEATSANGVIRGSSGGALRKHRMCAILVAFLNDPQCQNKQDERKVQIPCWDKPGSPCTDYAGISVKDLYCNADGYHETAFQGTDTCDETKGQKETVDILKNQCTYGMKFSSCIPGDCHFDDDAVIVDGLWSANAVVEEGTALVV
ncbi:expressed unknown protein [Seminavis robusta]|uniref:Uncharacterized protein n=1 Tax=Seminavis robusta TaxID=568900 RepID=A0A9N8HGL2_9STRA|nr:expressed unknown protein [Seminavis robusta]|eukprot:Sro643_g180270.1 n/a (147) ;mRNA; r:17722-18162